MLPSSSASQPQRQRAASTSSLDDRGRLLQRYEAEKSSLNDIYLKFQANDLPDDDSFWRRQLKDKFSDAEWGVIDRGFSPEEYSDDSGFEEFSEDQYANISMAPFASPPDVASRERFHTRVREDQSRGGQRSGTAFTARPPNESDKELIAAWIGQNIYSTSEDIHSLRVPYVSPILHRHDVEYMSQKDIDFFESDFPRRIDRLLDFHRIAFEKDVEVAKQCYEYQMNPRLGKEEVAKLQAKLIKDHIESMQKLMTRNAEEIKLENAKLEEGYKRAKANGGWQQKQKRPAMQKQSTSEGRNRSSSLSGSSTTDATQSQSRPARKEKPNIQRTSNQVPFIPEDPPAPSTGRGQSQSSATEAAPKLFRDLFGEETERWVPPASATSSTKATKTSSGRSTSSGSTSTTRQNNRKGKEKDQTPVPGPSRLARNNSAPVRHVRFEELGPTFLEPDVRSHYRSSSFPVVNEDEDDSTSSSTATATPSTYGGTASSHAFWIPPNSAREHSDSEVVWHSDDDSIRIRAPSTSPEDNSSGFQSGVDEPLFSHQWDSHPHRRPRGVPRVRRASEAAKYDGSRVSQLRAKFEGVA